MDLDHAPLLVLYDTGAANDVGIAQAHLAPRSHAEEALGRIFKKIILFYVQFPRKGYLTAPHLGLLGMVGGLEFLHLILGIVVDDYLERPQHRHDPRRTLVQVLTDT